MHHWPRPIPFWTKTLRWFSWLGALLLLLWLARSITSGTRWEFVLQAPAELHDLWSRAVPPRWEILPTLWKPLWETIQIATLGTLLALGGGTLLATLAARNINPFKPLRFVALAVIAAARSINSLVWALLFVKLFGPGAFAGILAVAAHSLGFVGKLLYESAEEVNPLPIEAIRATGASRPSTVLYAIIPQVEPQFWTVAFYRWDINIREAVIVGLVGAGGLGLELDARVNDLAWASAAAILLLLIAITALSEWISGLVRFSNLAPEN